jgi:hypothetical protein
VNESVQLEPNLILWTARERWVFGSVSAALGLIWGLLGVLLLSTFGLLWSDFTGERDSARASFAVTLGMSFGAVHAGKLWHRSIKPSARSWVFSRHDYVHLSITWGFRTVLLGVLWGSVLVIPFQILWEPSVSPLLSKGLPVLEVLVRMVLGLMALWLQGLLFGVFVGVLSVVPVGMLMAPVSIFVWRKTLGLLESQRGPDQA